jgi:hypothetical protein
MRCRRTALGDLHRQRHDHTGHQQRYPGGDQQRTPDRVGAMAQDPNEDADLHDDAELEQAAARRSSGIAQQTDAGSGTGEGSPSTEEPGTLEGGTAAGNPVAGREIDHADAADALTRSSDS